MAAAPFKETEEKNGRHVYWVKAEIPDCSAALKATKKIAHLLKGKKDPRNCPEVAQCWFCLM